MPAVSKIIARHDAPATSIALPAGERLVAPEVLYYPGFFYSGTLFWPLSAQGLKFPELEITKHRRNLRLLATIFPRIYIPRSHLISHLHPAAIDVVGGFTNTRDYQFLTDKGILVSSIRPSLDEKADTERIRDRAMKTDWLRALPINAMANVERAKSISVDSLAESESNRQHFPEFLQRLRGGSHKKIDHLAHAGEHKDVPFFHEKFAKALLDAHLDAELKVFIWRETNSMYLEEGIVRPAGVSYFDQEIESDSYAVYGGFARYLFSPDAIASFLSLRLDDHELATLLNGDIAQVLAFREQQSLKFDVWNKFRSAYFEMVAELTALLPRGAQAHAHAGLQDMFRAYMNGRNFEQYAVDVEKAVSTVAGSVAGMPLKPVTEIGIVRRISQRVNWSLRKPDLMRGLKQIRAASNMN